MIRRARDGKGWAETGYAATSTISCSKCNEIVFPYPTSESQLARRCTIFQTVY